MASLDMSLDELQQSRGNNQRGNQRNRNQSKGKQTGKGKGKGNKTQGGVVRKTGVSRTTRESSVPYKPAVKTVETGKIFGLAQSGTDNRSVPRGRGGSSFVSSAPGILQRLGGKSNEKAASGTPVIVQNLPNDLNPGEVEELFAAIGEVIGVSVSRQGGKNQAEVRFARQSNAQAAIKEYHGRELDGKPMVVKLGTNNPKKENPLNTHIPQVEATNKAAMFGTSLSNVQFDNTTLRGKNHQQNRRGAGEANVQFTINLNHQAGKGNKKKNINAKPPMNQNKKPQQKKAQQTMKPKKTPSTKPSEDDLNADMDAYFGQNTSE